MQPIMVLLAPLLLFPGSGMPDGEGEYVLEDLAVPTHGHALMPSLARGADGVVRLSWIERQGGRRARMLLSTFQGGRLADPVEVSSGDDWFINWADFPTTSALADGTLIAVWLRRSGRGAGAYGIALSHSADSGTTWTAPQWLHGDHSPSEHGFVSLSALDSDHFLAIWLEGGGSGTERGEGRHAGGGAHASGHSKRSTQRLWSRTIGRDGSLGTQMLVDARVCDCCQTSLVSAGNGTLVAAWRDRSLEEVRDIYFARFDGKRWSEGRAVHDDHWVLEGCPVNGPRLAGASDDLACAWYTGGERAGTYVAFAGAGKAHLGTLGKKGEGFSDPERVDSGASEGRIDAQFMGDGTLLVTWMEHTTDGVWWLARVFEANGRAGKPIRIAPTDSDRRSGLLRCAGLKGGALLVWSDPDTQGVLAALLKREL